MKTDLPHKAISAVDYSNYMGAVISYVSHHDVIVHIAEEGKEDILLLGRGLFDRLFSAGKRNVEVKDEMVSWEVPIDAETEKAFRALIAPTGFTLEQVAEMFLCWCALYPEDAKAWLQKAAKEQRVALKENTEKSD